MRKVEVKRKLFLRYFVCCGDNLDHLRPFEVYPNNVPFESQSSVVMRAKIVTTRKLQRLRTNANTIKFISVEPSYVLVFQSVLKVLNAR